MPFRVNDMPFRVNDMIRKLKNIDALNKKIEIEKRKIATRLANPIEHFEPSRQVEPETELPDYEPRNMNSRELGKQILIDMLIAPTTVLPSVIGASVLIIGWAIGSAVTIFAGLMGILAGIGMAVTKFIWGFDKQIEKTFAKIQEEEVKKKQARIDQLRKRLIQDRDARTAAALKDAQEIYLQFKHDCKQGIYEVYADVAQKVEELYEMCIKQVERSCKLFAAARKLPERMRLPILQDRDKVIKGIQDAVESLVSTVQAFHQFTSDESAAELQTRREELDASLAIAKQTEEQMAALGVGAKRLRS